MIRIYQKSVITALLFLITQQLIAQINDTVPVSVNPAMLEIFNSKYPKTYTIAGITVVGSKAFDQNLIISISGIAVGDKVQLPGSDAFGKAITKLWKQSLVANVEIIITKLDGTDIYLEFDIKERPRLLDYTFIGIKKGEKDDLDPKIGLAKDRVLTENM